MYDYNVLQNIHTTGNCWKGLDKQKRVDLLNDEIMVTKFSF